MRLDLGCGDRAGDAVGVDIAFDALRRRGGMAVVARGEMLPFRDGVFESINSLVALPYMDVPVALREAHRVLRPGGTFRAKVFPFTYAVSEIREARGWRNRVYRGYVVVNGVVLSLLGVCLPAFGRRRESFQTRAGMARMLQRAGFESLPAEWDARVTWPHAGECWIIGRKPVPSVSSSHWY